MQVFGIIRQNRKALLIDEEMESLGEVIHPLDNIGDLMYVRDFIR